jgi:uncharacterized membrane protein YidH (DUF202 family)
MNEEPSKDAAKDERPLTIWQIASSTAAAAFGVQNRANRERDFNRGKPLHFIIAGIVFTAVFVLIVVSVVQFILRSASS